MRERVIVETANVQNAHRKINRRFGVRRVECSCFIGMLVNVHLQIEDLLDVSRRAFHVQNHAIRVFSSYFQTVGLYEVDERLISVFARSESLGELVWRQIMAVEGTDW